MRPFYGLTLLLLAVSAGGLQGQARPAHRATRPRPFFLPRPGEHTAFWVGFGAGLTLSPRLWCEGPGCGGVG